MIAGLIQTKISFLYSQKPQPDSLITGELDTIAKGAQTPFEQASQNVATKTVSNRVKTATSTALLLFGLAFGTQVMATESPYEALADASGKTMLVVKEGTFSPTEQQMLEKEMEELLSKKNFAKENFQYYLTLPQNDKIKTLQCYKIGKEGNVDPKKLLFGVSTSISLQKELSQQKKIVEAYLKENKYEMYVGQKLISLLDDVIKYIPGAERVFEKDRSVFEQIDAKRSEMSNIIGQKLDKESDRLIKSIQVLDALLKAL